MVAKYQVDMSSHIFWFGWFFSAYNKFIWMEFKNVVEKEIQILIFKSKNDVMALYNLFSRDYFKSSCCSSRTLMSSFECWICSPTKIKWRKHVYFDSISLNRAFNSIIVYYFVTRLLVYSLFKRIVKFSQRSLHFYLLINSNTYISRLFKCFTRQSNANPAW